MKVKYNDDRDDLYCIECKERINLGEKYAEITETYLSEKIRKTYHISCVPIQEEE